MDVKKWANNVAAIIPDSLVSSGTFNLTLPQVSGVSDTTRNRKLPS